MLQSLPAHANPLHSQLTNTIRAMFTGLTAAERKWHYSCDPTDLKGYQSLLSSFSSSISAAKTAFHNDKISSITDAQILFSTLKLLFSPSPLPLDINLLAHTFACFFTVNVLAIGGQFFEPLRDKQSTLVKGTYSPCSGLSPRAWQLQANHYVFFLSLLVNGSPPPSLAVVKAPKSKACHNMKAPKSAICTTSYGHLGQCGFFLV